MYLHVVFNLPIKKFFHYRSSTTQNITKGFRVLAPFRKKKLIGYVISVEKEKPDVNFEIKEISSVLDKTPLFNEKILHLATWMSRVYLCSLGEALAMILPGGRKERESELEVFEEKLQDYDLADQQIRAINRILQEKEGQFYLFGVTGSGKTDVFFEVAKEIVREGRDVIYLVPEISLVHQVVAVFVREFGDVVSIFHSGMTPSQRLNEWMRIIEGESKVVIGVRSAVFSPVKSLGLIILDEEHETSYKSNFTPRYHARQVASYRCQKEKALLVMGSATPSIEAYHQMNIGKLKKIFLPERLSGGKLPQIEIVDMKKEKGLFSNKLINAIKEVHHKGGQTILFLNRRGFAYLFFCRTCGFEMKCKNCAVSLTFHKSKNIMICHYCGYKAKPPDVCPACNSLDIGYTGFGTERVEDETNRLFPELKIKRIDTDSVRNKKKLKRLLTDFKDQRYDLLLGTQMVAKGFNFPKVKLVGIVSVDQGLQLPDFKALERTFALITQVSGRAGRMTADGRVIVQTYKPENNVIQYAANGRLEDFYQEELDYRKTLKFPPYYRLIRLVCRGRNRKKVFTALSGLFNQLNAQKGSKFDILGPVECPIAILANNYRFHIVLRSKNISVLHKSVRRIISDYVLPINVFLEVDVDPISLL